jgi:type III pantothenate kinase
MLHQMELNPRHPGPALIAVAIGNTRTSFASFQGPRLASEARTLPNSDPVLVARAIDTLVAGAAESVIVIGTVNPGMADTLESSLSGSSGERVYRLGRDLLIPIANALTDDSTVGHDRLLCALGAYTRAEQACVVIDAGTAITVDFVDGEGTFQGGVIAPGLNMMLAAMHEKTAALPKITFTPPDPTLGPFGKETRHAMLLGTLNAARGLVRTMIEQYAEAFGAYPQIIATGGDAAALFEGDDLVEHIVPELQLIGIAAACTRVLTGEDASGPIGLGQAEDDEFEE